MAISLRTPRTTREWGAFAVNFTLHGAGERLACHRKGPLQSQADCRRMGMGWVE
jgi:hypothetical protein